MARQRPRAPRSAAREAVERAAARSAPRPAVPSEPASDFGPSEAFSAPAATSPLPTAPRARLGLPWPLPALLVWASAWAVFISLARAGWGVALALLAGAALGVLGSVLGHSWWRRFMLALGFPLSLLASGLVSLPAWLWLLPLGFVLLVYPINAWRDAPIFPTPLAALDGLPGVIALAPGARVLDAGCGLGAGLRALRRAWPEAELHGLEWSWPLRWACALRCPWARVRRADIWRASWADYQVVYLFQRPESMARALAKAQAEMAPGSWLVSLEFEVAGQACHRRLQAPDGRPVWVYAL